jgi:hypothetical protein
LIRRPLQVALALAGVAVTPFSGCGFARTEPPRSPPPSVGEARSEFFNDVVPRLEGLCPYSVPLFGASEVAGLRHVDFRGCQPLPSLGKLPKVKRLRPTKVSSKPAMERAPEERVGSPLSQAFEAELGAVAVEDSGRAGLSFAGGPTP